MQEVDKIDQYLPKITHLNKEYINKVEDLFRYRQGQNVSQKHYDRNIIINPKSFFNLIQSNFLGQIKKTNIVQYYELKLEVLRYLIFLIEDFPLNAKFIYQEAFLVVQKHSKVNIVTYLIKDISQTYHFLRQHSSQQKTVFKDYIALCRTVFNNLCSVCTLKTSELKLITNSLTQFYYEELLSTQLVGDGFRLLDAGLQQRNITPHLYFIDNNKNDSVKVLFSNNKWPFSKGMTLFMTINALKITNSKLLWLKTEDGNELIVKIENGKLCVECLNKDNNQRNSIQICDFPYNTLTTIGIQLQPISEGLFKSISYILNININGRQQKNLTSKIPKFESNEFVVQFALLKNFIGNLYSIIISARPELNNYDQLCKFSPLGICRQTLVWNLIDKKVLKNQKVLLRFTTQLCP